MVRPMRIYKIAMISMGPRKKRNALSSYMGQLDGRAWSNIAQNADSSIRCVESGQKKHNTKTIMPTT
jgi:hypothetical protein